MDIKALVHADYLDIIFYNRNKDYGGYELRRHYSRRMAKAVALLYSALAALVLFAVLYRPVVAIDRIFPQPVVEITDIVIPLPAQPTIVKPPVSAPKIKTTLFSVPVITKDPIPDDKHMQGASDLHNTTVGAGSDGDSTDVGIGPGTEGTDKGKAIKEDIKPEEPRIYVEQMPQFNGDMAAYLAGHVKYPGAARENGIEGRVVIAFIVNEDGAVTGAKVVKGIGGGCDEEALRVVSAMPKWKPGRQNGKSVRVYFNLAVNFVLE